MEELDLKKIFTIFWKRRTQVNLIILVFAIIGIVYSYFIIKPKYKATTKLVLTQSTVDSKDDSITQADINLNSKLVSTYGEIIKTDNVLKTVVNNINNPEITIKDIKENVTVESVKETELLEITVTNTNPNYAAQIANEIAKVFCERVVEIYSISNTYILDKAEPDATPYNINHVRDIFIFIFIGVMVATIYILISDILDNTIKNEQDIEQIGGMLVLSTIPDYSLENKRGGRIK